MTAPNKSTKRARKALDALYRDLPTIACRGLCQEACGPIFMSAVEWERITETLGHAPEGDATLRCPMLCHDSGRCTVYAIRPVICRIWGLVKAMACPHGCKPSRWLTDPEARRILHEAEKISRRKESAR